MIRTVTLRRVSIHLHRHVKDSMGWRRKCDDSATGMGGMKELFMTDASLQPVGSKDWETMMNVRHLALRDEDVVSKMDLSHATNAPTNAMARLHPACRSRASVRGGVRGFYERTSPWLVPLPASTLFRFVVDRDAARGLRRCVRWRTSVSRKRKRG